MTCAGSSSTRARWWILWSGTLAASLTAAEWKGWEVAGYAELESRLFPESPAFAGQHRGPGISLALEPEVFRRWEESETTVRVRPFVRLDSLDPDRTHGDLRELLWHKVSEQWELRAGVGKVFWGVTESRHLVDVINQTDLVEDLDAEEKLGQPMLDLTWVTPSLGSVDFFYLPYFRERTFPGRHGRLRFPQPVDTDHPRYESDLEEWHPDVAVRWAHDLGDFDWGLSYFHGTSRDPLFEPSVDGSGRPVVRPVYNRMHQAGLDGQWTRDGWLLKFEGLAREGKGQHFQAVSTGFEYTFYGVLGSQADLGTLLEYHWDRRGDQALTAFNHDLFGGVRVTWNDVQDTSLLSGLLYDYRNGATSWRTEFERRLGSRFTLAVEGQWFAVQEAEDLTYAFRDDSYLQTALRYYF